MAQKITQEIIEQMFSLYEEIGTYSGVAKKLSVSPATVSRYIKQKNATRNYSNCSIQPIPIEQITKENIFSFAVLTSEEKESYEKWIKEFQ